MDIDIDWDLYLDYPDKAASEIGKILYRGDLALFLGAGVWKSFKLPDWHSLARSMACEMCVEGKGINHKRISGAALDGKFSEIRRKCKDTADFHRLVRKWLYYHWRSKKGNWASDTLVALGSLLAGSYRGRVDTVLTSNYDSILEMYLRLYGFVPQSVTTFPCLLTGADVTIFHSHGYLPLEAEDGSDSERIVLDRQSYLSVMGNPESPSKKMMEYVLGFKTILAVGLSGEDPYSGSVIAYVNEKNLGRRIMGFWMVGPNEQEQKIADLRESGFAAVKLPDFAELPEFLFKVARNAATKVVHSRKV
jgi:hypothetical protein